jgi:glutathione S-transferase
MNIEASLPEAGALVWRDKPAVRADVARIDALWQELLQASGGPMLFGGFTAADAFFAPVCMRLRTYGLQVSEASAAYVRRLADQPGVAAWIADALVEADFREFEEPYRLQR